MKHSGRLPYTIGIVFVISLSCSHMLKPKNNYFIKRFFDVYIGWIIRRHFHQVEFNRPGFDADRAILLIANHFSWWDGFLLYYVNKAVFKKKFHIMVLEESIRKMGFLRYIGSFSIAKGSRQIFESLDYAAGLLHHPGNMVVIFPQGKLYSNFVDIIAFQKGVQRIAGGGGVGFQYVFAASFIEGFEQKKPGVHIYLNVLSINDTQPNDVPAAYQQHYNFSKQQQTNMSV